MTAKNTSFLTPAQLKALAFARGNKGVVYCGNNVDSQGKQIRVVSGALRALAKLGFGSCDQEIGSGQLFFRVS